MVAMNCGIVVEVLLFWLMDESVSACYKKHFAFMTMRAAMMGTGMPH